MAILFTIAIKHKERKHFAPKTRIEKNKRAYSIKQKFKSKEQ